METQIILFIVLCLGLLCLTLIRVIQTSKQAHKKNLNGLNILDELIHIIQLTQQHRGIHSGFLNGQTALQNKLTHIEQEINTHCQAIQSLSDQIDPRTYANIRSEFLQWQRLLEQNQLDANSSFQAHSGLISRFLESLWDMADDFALTTSSNKKVQVLANNLVRILPELAESIGQVRALTMQVSNSDRCTPDKKLHLLFTLSKIEQDMEKVQQEISSDALQQLQQFVDEVRLSIDNKSLPDKNPDIFFQKATENIDAIFGFMQKGLENIRKELA